MTAEDADAHLTRHDPDAPLQLLFANGKQPMPGSALELHSMMEQGFASELVIAFIQSYSQLCEHHVFSRVIGLSERALQRRIKAPEPLTVEQSNSTWRLARGLCRAEEVLGDRQQALNWMTSAAMGLQGRTPLELLTTQIGFELVEDLLTRMEYGVYS